MSVNFRLSKYLSHWLYRVNEHSVHSPFFYDLYTKIIAQRSSKEISIPEDFKIQATQNNSNLESPSNLLSKTKISFTETINKIVPTRVEPNKLASFYLDLLYYFDVRRVIYIDTNIDITALYLVQKRNCKVFAFSNNSFSMNIHSENFYFFKGPIESQLSHFLETSSKYEMILINVNGYGAIMNYFQLVLNKMPPKSFIVITDIYRSEEEEKAWIELKKNPIVNGSIDLFYCGILIFNSNLNNQDYIFALS